MRRALALFSTAIVAAGVLALAAPATTAQAAELPDSIIDGGFIISDEEFFDGSAMTAEEIQTFLETQVAACASGAMCLREFTQTHLDKAADQYCAAMAGGTDDTAAQIIYKSAVACSINPKVLLVMLQKEQSLVTLTNPSQSRFDRAMGFACPDSGPNNSANCDIAHYGFANQVYRGARQMQVYTKNPNSFNYKPGQVNTIKWHPSSVCGTSQVYIQNRATANLYIYTPYRPNIAALAAGWSTGDACSSYGNRNFYNYYVAWFAPEIAPPVGAPALVAPCTQPPTADIAVHSTTATVNTDWLNLRQGPTMLCTQGVTSLPRGTSITITGQYGAWSRATVSGSTVWMMTEYLSFTGITGAPSAHVGPCAAPSDGQIVAASGEFLTTSSALNARIAPSTSCSMDVSTLSTGTKVTRLATFGTWTFVQAGNKRAWVSSEYLKPAPAPAPSPPPAPPAPPAPAPMVVNTTSPALNFRAGNSMSTAVLAVIPRNTKLTVTATSGIWLKVSYGGRIGWVHSDFVQVQTTSSAPSSPAPSSSSSKIVTTSPALNFRASNSMNAAVLAVIPRNTKLTVTATSGIWLRVSYSGRVGWVHSDFVRYETTSSAPSTPAPSSSTPKVVTTTSPALNFRAGTSMSTAVMAVIPRNTKLTVTAISGIWFKVTYGGRIGWVHSDFVK